jgi:hypothetical protein
MFKQLSDNNVRNREKLCGVSGVFPMDSRGFKAMEEERNKQRNG